MRTSVLIVAAILGCAIAQTPTGTNYCNATGTFCAMCTDKSPNKSCDACGKNTVVTPVTSAPGVNECKPGTATNCAAASAVAGQCATCNSGFALVLDGDKPNTCVADTTGKVTDCAAYTKKGTDAVVCVACNPGKVLVDANCNTAITIANCNVATNNGGTQICGACKAGFAFKGAAGTTCDTAVSGATAGCLRVSDDLKACLGPVPCNMTTGWWNSDINFVCTKYTSIATAAFALIASFFFSN
jgi:hypothetical protein